MQSMTPQLIEKTAQDIVGYWDESTANDKDKIKIMEMVRDYYSDRNEHLVDQYLSALAQRVLDKNSPQTSFEE